MNNFWQRAVSGAVFVLIIAGSCLYGFSNWVFSIIMLLALDEWMRLNGITKIPPRALLLSAAGLPASVYCLNLTTSGVFGFITCFFPLFFIFEMFRKDGELRTVHAQLAALVYIYVPFVLAISLYKTGLKGVVASSSFPILLLCMVLIWCNDTFAYLTGKLMGRTKIFSVLSPKKTLEGYLGGIVCTMAASVIFYYATPSYTLSYFIGLGAVVAIAASLGDLAESFIKRQIGVKDSGNIMPGHGGVLDRFDSFLFVIPAVVLYEMVCDTILNRDIISKIM